MSGSCERKQIEGASKSGADAGGNKMTGIDIEFAKKILAEHGALTIDMLEAFVRDNVRELLFCTEDAVLLHHKCGLHMLWAKNVAEGVKALSDAQNIHCCVTHGEHAMKAIAESKPHFTIDPACIQYCRQSRDIIPLNGVCAIRHLCEEDAQTVVDNYKFEPDINHVKQIIREGRMFGAEVDGKLAAFIGSHSDGSCGMLEVFPEYRRRGIGMELELFLQNHQLEKGWMPYGHVYVTNDASIKMQSKIGLDVSNDYIWWTFDDSES